MNKIKVPISEKYCLSIQEASAYFNIGIKNMRRLAEDHTGIFSVMKGNTFLIIRSEFEKYLRSGYLGKGEDEEIE